MLDHVSISVKNYALNLKFYDETLAILGCQRLLTIDIPEHQVQCAGYGKEGRPHLWISPMGRADEEMGRARGMHIAFSAPNVKAVQDWYAKCLALGGKDNGEPGPRTEYHPHYFGAFVIDPNGWRIEACFHHYNPV